MVNGELLEALPLKLDTRILAITTLFYILLKFVLTSEKRQGKIKKMEVLRKRGGN